MSDAAFLTRFPTLRAPARWRQAIRAELVVLAGTRPLRWLWLIAAMALFASGDTFPDRYSPPFEDVWTLAVLMFFLPLVWQGERHRQTSVLPIGELAREVLRLACGAVYAAVILALSIAAYTVVLVRMTGRATLDGAGGWYAQGTVGGFPAWYPVALFAVGMAHYLLGSAVMLHSERPERTLPAAFLAGQIMMGVLDIGWVTTELVWEYAEAEVHGTMRGRTSLTPTLALVRLGLAVAVMALAIAAAHARRRVRWSLPNPLRAWELARRAHTRPPAGALQVPRMRASLVMVAVRQFVVLAPRMALPLLTAGFFAWRRWNTETQAAGDAPVFVSGHTPFGEIWLVLFLFPVLVWLNEHRTEAWDDARPAGAMSWRVLHAAAGMVWLQILMLVLLTGATGGAMAAGTLRSPAELPAYLWLGLPAATLLLYCAGTVVIVLADRPLIAGIIGMQLFMGVLVILELALGDGGDRELIGFTPSRVLAPAGWTGSENWSAGLALLWTPVFVAAALGAIRRRARREQPGSAPEAATATGLARYLSKRRRPIPAR